MSRNPINDMRHSRLMASLGLPDAEDNPMSNPSDDELRTRGWMVGPLPKPRPLNDTMTGEQESHLTHIIEGFIARVDPKYRKGQAEHGGNLFDMPAAQLIDCAIDEAIDQVVYLLTLRDKVTGTKENDNG